MQQYLSARPQRNPVSLACVMPLLHRVTGIFRSNHFCSFSLGKLLQNRVLYMHCLCVCFLIVSQVWGFPAGSSGYDSALPSAEGHTFDAWLGSHVLCNQKSLHLKRKVFFFNDRFLSLRIKMGLPPELVVSCISVTAAVVRRSIITRQAWLSS